MKRCFHCGYEGADGKFCPRCGAGLADVDPNATEAVSYQQPPVQDYVQPVQEETITLGSWMVTLLLSMIPCVNLIMLFVWAFGGNGPVSKSNWAKAQLIFMLISVVLSLIISIVMASLGASLFQTLMFY